MSILKNDWAVYLESEFQKPYYIRLREYLIEEYQTETIYPDKHDIFNALHYTSYENTKVVILGQDPYHGFGQAHGLSFSVKPGIPAPPSLQNIFKEMESDVGCVRPNNGYLVNWAKQGVLLLNTVLTVREGRPQSHKGLGWEIFTDEVISVLNQRERPVIFVLWGKPALEKRKLITKTDHLILSSPHPSPLSAHRGFFGSRPFSRINQFLKEIGSSEINWQIPDL